MLEVVVRRVGRTKHVKLDLKPRQKTNSIFQLLRTWVVVGCNLQ